MKNEILKYLEYSLFVHNYVIVPGLGGFIVNMECPRPGLNVEPPKFRIVFNPELNHDDGILVSYIVNDEKITCNAASQRIKDFVKNLKHDLASGRVVAFRLGQFVMDSDKNISFVADRSSVHPDFFGLASVNLKYLSDIKDESRRTTKRIYLRKVIGTSAAAVAALFLFVVPSANISDKGISQEAGFVNILTTSLSVTSDVDSLPIVREDVVFPEKRDGRTYYIVVGGEESELRAGQLLERTRQAGFADAAIVESADRYRIYVASFAEKADGESFLETFRKTNPKYETAWLFSKRN